MFKAAIPFVAQNLAANVYTYLKIAELIQDIQIPDTMECIGLSIEFSAAVTAGSLTLEIRRNTSAKITIAGVNADTVKRYLKGLGYIWTAGTDLNVRVLTTADFAPDATLNMCVVVWLASQKEEIV